jgi:hypothetical protein
MFWYVGPAALSVVTVITLIGSPLGSGVVACAPPAQAADATATEATATNRRCRDRLERSGSAVVDFM